jgi:hypothetical protein
MSPETLQRRATLVLAAATFLFVADLFLAWQKVAVEVAGVVAVDATASGWRGWGLLGGSFAIALFVLSRHELWAGREVPRHETATALLGLGVLGTTALTVFTGSATVQTQSVGVEVQTTLWPAWIGLALAVVIAAAAFVPVVTSEGVERRKLAM